MFLLLFFSTIVANIAYLSSLLELQRALMIRVESYWSSIGSPRGLAMRDGSIMLRVLFSSLLTDVCKQSGMAGLLLKVRVLFSLGGVLTLAVMAWVLVTKGPA